MVKLIWMRASGSVSVTMPKRPKGQKPSAELIAMQDDFLADDGKNKAAQWLGRRGGQASAKNLSSQRKSEIAKKAAAARWKK